MKDFFIDIGIGFALAFAIVLVLVFLGDSNMFIYNNF